MADVTDPGRASLRGAGAAYRRGIIQGFTGGPYPADWSANEHFRAGLAVGKAFAAMADKQVEAFLARQTPADPATLPVLSEVPK